MKLKINSVGEEAIQVHVEGEDYSVADILHKELLSIRHVRFAGVAPPHPLLKILTIQIHTDGADANSLLSEALVNARKKLDELLALAKQAFPASIGKREPLQTSAFHKAEQSVTKINSQDATDGQAMSTSTENVRAPQQTNGI